MRLVYEPILPNGYTRLEYLEAFSSRNVAYISIPYTPNTNTNFETKVRYNTSTTTNTWAMGSTVWWGVHLLGTDEKIGIANSSGTASKAYGDYTFGTDAILKLDGNSVYVNGELVGTITKTNATSTIDLFRYYNGSNLWWDGRIYYLKIDDGTTKINLIPALRNSDSEPGMYDTVSGTFYTNAGAGEFLYPTPAEPEDDNVIDNPRYQQVEYLESTGTQYIDTLLAGNQDTAIECKFNTTSYTSTNYVSLLGYYSGTDNSITGFMGISSGYGRSRFGNTSTVDTAVSLNTDYVLYMDKTKFKLNNAETSWSCTNTFTTEGTLRLFSRYIETYGNFNGKIYYAKIWKDGELVRHFIPVIRKVDNKPGMYDKVTGNFYTNSGTGEFTYGDKVNQTLPAAYDRLDYIESTTTVTSSGPYIDTGIEALDTTSFMIDFSFNNTAYGQGMGEGYLGGKRFTVAGFYKSTGSTYFGYAYNSWYDTDVAIDTNRHTFELDAYNKKYYLDNHTYNIPNVSYTSEGKTIGLFCRICNSNGTTYPNWFCAGKMYGARIKQNGILVRDLVPALRKADNKPGMYDFVSGQFFTNLGSGEFTYAYPAKPLSNNKLRLVKSGYTTPTLTKPLVTRLIAGGYV